MNEKLLQFIWKLRYFEKSSLSTITGETISIMNPGRHNNNQGPDFLEARIRINNTIWVGNIELHVKTTDWKAHGHEADINYDNIILHVVWQHDEDCKPEIPVLELRDRVPKMLLDRYLQWMNKKEFIPCEKEISLVQPLSWMNWKDRLVAERLHRKSKKIFDLLKETNDHWEEMFWQIIARNFGSPVNNDAFEIMARAIPASVLAKHKNQIHQLEALLFGQAGLLETKFIEDYPIMLQREYLFLKKKYQLPPNFIQVHFLRMRPGNFPTVRLAQLAMLVHVSVHLFSGIRESVSLKGIRQMLSVTANDYWHYHYRFDELSKYKMKTLGKEMIDNLIINSVIPVLFSYGVIQSEKKYKERALRWLGETSAETNGITKGFERFGLNTQTAHDSQALLELKKEYCDAKRCLECAVGSNLLKRG